MNKKEYLNELEEHLINYSFDDDAIDDIIEEYDMMIDEANEDMPGEPLEDLLGSPKEIAKNLRTTEAFKRAKNNKIVALTPFLSAIIFFILGFGFDLWHPGWLVFLLIPITGIFSVKHHKVKTYIISMMPFISLLIFLSIGLITDVWHPTWTVFLLIPASSIFAGDNERSLLNGSLFIIIPVIYLLSYYFFPFQFNWIILLLLIFPAYDGGVFIFKINGVRNKRLEGISVLVLFALAVIYGVFGSLYGIWHPLWVIFLLFPVYVMIISKHYFKESIPLVGYMPFISVIFFILAGELFDSGYQWSWLFFLLIPIVAIIQD